MSKKIEQKAIETIRVLSIEQVGKANSGHPGIALGAAPMIHTLYSSFMNVLPNNPNWFDRDRFVLSAGHGSSMLYSMLHLSGFDVKKEDLMKFRQYGSITPGHPENHLTQGVDATAGPLGQGISMAVGMSIAESFLAAKYNKENLDIVNHYTYVICGDGDLQEGVAQEAMSLAGHLGLGKLIVLYDSNDIQLDTEVALANTENTRMKMIGMNWHYQMVPDGNRTEDIESAIKKAQEQADQPSIIEIKTIIGLHSSLAGTSKVHGSPLPKEEVADFRRKLGGEAFSVEQEVYDFYLDKLARANTKYNEWEEKLEQYKEKYNEEYQEFVKAINGETVLDMSGISFPSDYNGATRASGGKVLDYINSIHPTTIGGSADLSSSTKVKGPNGVYSKENRVGRNILFGVREHAMAAISNGLALHGGVVPFCGGFMVFSDYMKPAIRLSALMELPVIYAFTHDSIAVGEDGPTHQPIEQLTMLRSIPNMNVMRPADASEVKASWEYAINHGKDHPSAIIMTRQDVPSVTEYDFDTFQKGAYIVKKEDKQLDGILIASGSEVSLALEAQELLSNDGFDVRVVSMPSTFLFDKQSEEYKEMILPSHISRKLAIEMSEASTYYKYVGTLGKVYNITTFGASSPGEVVVEKYGFTKQKIKDAFLNMREYHIQ